MRFLLVHSPFLGPAIWTQLAAVLDEAGHDVIAVDIRPGLISGSAAYEKMSACVTAAAAPDVRVVVHSGAGGLAPSIWAADPRLSRCIFLDAILPHPGRSWMETIPSAMSTRLTDAASAGMLPPWPAWLPSGTLEFLLPDGETREIIASEACNSPLTFAEAKAPVVSEWRGSCRCAYLQLSDAYDREAERALEFPMIVDHFPGHHFSMVTQAGQIAEQVVDLALGLA